jgi:chromosome segregation ATPase
VNLFSIKAKRRRRITGMSLVMRPKDPLGVLRDPPRPIESLQGGNLLVTNETNESLLETNESLRETNESLRETNESLRETNESLLETNESLRETNESLQETKRTQLPHKSPSKMTLQGVKENLLDTKKDLPETKKDLPETKESLLILTSTSKTNLSEVKEPKKNLPGTNGRKMLRLGKHHPEVLPRRFEVLHLL